MGTGLLALRSVELEVLAAAYRRSSRWQQAGTEHRTKTMKSSKAAGNGSYVFYPSQNVLQAYLDKAALRVVLPFGLTTPHGLEQVRSKYKEIHTISHCGCEQALQVL